MSDTRQPLSRSFTTRMLLRYALPSMAMMVCLTIYTLVDGLFIAHCVGSIGLSAQTMFGPLWSLEIGAGVMLAAGGSALIGKRLGQRRVESAGRLFTALVVLTAGLGAFFALVGIFLAGPLALLLGASPLQAPYCTDYMRVHMAFDGALFLQLLFQSFFATAGRPGLGFAISAAAGVLNGVLDYVFMVPLHLGMTGAALATGAGCVFSAAAGVLFFAGGCSELRFARPRMSLAALRQILSNGMSEMVTNLAVCTSGFLFNISFMKLAGEDGVAALTIVYYFEFLFTSLLFGYAQGVAPVISYKFGAQDKAQLRLCIRRSIGLMAVCGLLTFALSVGTIGQSLSLFVPRGSAVWELAHAGFPLYAIAFLFGGVNIFVCGAFTALSNGPVSAVISAARTFVFIVPAILFLPHVLGLAGLWLAMPTAEGLGLLVAVWYLVRLRRKYGY